MEIILDNRHVLFLTLLLPEDTFWRKHIDMKTTQFIQQVFSIIAIIYFMTILYLYGASGTIYYHLMFLLELLIQSYSQLEAMVLGNE